MKDFEIEGKKMAGQVAEKKQFQQVKDLLYRHTVVLGMTLRVEKAKKARKRWWFKGRQIIARFGLRNKGHWLEYG